MASTASALAHELPVPSPVVESDEEALLVSRAQAGDQIAFREIVDRYQTRVFSIIHRLLRDRNEAEDIAQEVFSSAFFAINRYQRQGSLMTWLYRITVNKCYEYLRRKRARPLAYEAALHEDWAKNLTAPAAAAHDDSTAGQDFLLKLLALVPQRDRTLLILKEVEGYTLNELAAMTGDTESALRIRLFRVRKKLLKAAKKPKRAAA